MCFCRLVLLVDTALSLVVEDMAVVAAAAEEESSDIARLLSCKCTR